MQIEQTQLRNTWVKNCSLDYTPPDMCFYILEAGDFHAVIKSAWAVAREYLRYVA